MISADTYDSKFIKADSRAALFAYGNAAYSTSHDGAIEVTDTFLSPASVHTLTLTEGYKNILMPVVGNLNVSSKAAGERAIGPGDLFRLDEKEIVLKNPFAEESINFLFIRLRESEIDEKQGDSLSLLDLHCKNKLIAGSGSSGQIKVGVYDSRVKDIVQHTYNGRSFFLYVLNGSFEVEGRLMEYRDTLYLWNTSQLELEALSEAAIILLIEY
jgi:redox-sensitive bicupin YhaK (pirin superfamily)